MQNSNENTRVSQRQERPWMCGFWTRWRSAAAPGTWHGQASSSLSLDSETVREWRQTSPYRIDLTIITCHIRKRIFQTDLLFCAFCAHNRGSTCHITVLCPLCLCCTFCTILYNKNNITNNHMIINMIISYDYALCVLSGFYVTSLNFNFLFQLLIFMCFYILLHCVIN